MASSCNSFPLLVPEISQRCYQSLLSVGISHEHCHLHRMISLPFTGFFFLGAGEYFGDGGGLYQVRILPQCITFLVLFHFLIFLISKFLLSLFFLFVSLVFLGPLAFMTLLLVHSQW